MKILFATNNVSKLSLYRSIFLDTDYEVLSLKDLDISKDVEETGITPAENALIKAREYMKAANIITISDDSGLYLDGVNEEDEPGIEVRRYNGKVLTDEEVLTRFLNIVKKHGGKITGRWKKAVAVVFPTGEEYTYSYDVEKIFVDKVNEKKHAGFPLDSISITPEFNKYTVELTEDENNELIKTSKKDLYDFLMNTLDNKAIK